MVREGTQGSPFRALILGLGALTLLLFAAACGGGGTAQKAEEDPSGETTQAGETQTSTGETTQAGETQAGETEVASAETQAAGELGHPSLGDEDAPVVMIEYADYQ